MAAFKNILVFSPNWVGDTIMALPMVAGLRTALPTARLVVVANPRVAPLWKNNPNIDQLWNLETTGGRGWLNQLRLFPTIKRGNFDVALILPHDFASAAVTWFARVPVRVGAAVGGRGWLLTHSQSNHLDQRHQPLIENYLNFLRQIGWEPGRPAPALPIDPAAQIAADENLAAHGIQPGDRIIGLAPGATYGPAKRWPPERFAELADRLAQEYQAKVLVLISPQEQSLGREIRSLTRQAPVFWDQSFPLLEVAALMKRCHLFIANDSGLMHMAAAVGTPVIAIFGSTSPTWTAPAGAGHIILHKPLACSPCFQRRCALKTYECLTSITVPEVLTAVATQLRKPPAAPP